MIRRLCLIIASLSLCSMSWAAGFSAADFGAKGDGVADDTAAISKALAAVGSDGGVVHLPAGKYRITGSLSVPQGTTLLGEGARWEGSAPLSS